MNNNPRNKLNERLDELGCRDEAVHFCTQQLHPGAVWKSTVVVCFPDGRSVKGRGESTRKSDAELAASQSAIERWHNECPDLIIDWEEIGADAQAGDALIKLGVYLSPETKSASKNSDRLQVLESDSQLAKTFDRWKAQDNSILEMWGPNLGEKRKATLVEAVLWRQFGAQIITATAPAQLKTLLETITLK